MSRAKPNILTVGYEIPGYPNEFVRYFSDRSLSDADLVVFKPTLTTEAIDTDLFPHPIRNGRIIHDEDHSWKIKNQLEHWKQELTDFVASGRNVIIILNRCETCYLSLGPRGARSLDSQVAGNYDSVPVNLIGLTTGTGSDLVKGRDHSVPYNIPEFVQKYVSYQSYFSDDGCLKVLYTTKDRKKIVSGIVETETGNYVFMPYVINEHEDFLERDDEGEEVYSDTGQRLGDELFNFFVSINANLQVDEFKTPPPDWSTSPSLRFKNEAVLSQKVDSITTSINELELRRASLLKESEELASFRGLLYETGKPLENCVTKALHILGFTAENYDDGTLEIDQIIVSPENVRYLGECEGKDSKPVNIEKLRQLSSSILEYTLKDENDGHVYGILFGNPARLSEPGHRQEWFTKRCLDAARRYNIALVRTPDLFPLIRYLMEHDADESFARSCREAIHKGLGGIVEFPAIPIAASEVPVNPPDGEPL